MLQCVLKTDTQSQESITDTNQLRITFDGIIKAGGGGDDDDVTATPPRCWCLEHENANAATEGSIRSSNNCSSDRAAKGTLCHGNRSEVIDNRRIIELLMV